MAPTSGACEETNNLGWLGFTESHRTNVKMDGRIYDSCFFFLLLLDAAVIPSVRGACLFFILYPTRCLIYPPHDRALLVFARTQMPLILYVSITRSHRSPPDRLGFFAVGTAVVFDFFLSSITINSEDGNLRISVRKSLPASLLFYVCCLSHISRPKYDFGLKI